MHTVDELTGGLLDAAVAACGEWGRAHEHFPTMTLDPSFSGFALVNGQCVLQPRNPFRQDPQVFMPSSLWEHGGPIVKRENIMLSPPTARVHRNGGPNGGWGASGIWHACTWHAGINGRRTFAYHDTDPLIAAMRCYVKNKLGEEVDLPDGGAR